MHRCCWLARAFLLVSFLLPAACGSSDGDSKDGEHSADSIDAPLCESRGYKIVGELNGVEQEFSGSQIYNDGINEFGPWVRFAVGPTQAGELTFEVPTPWKATKAEAITSASYTAQNGYVAAFDEGRVLWGPQRTDVITTPGSVRFALTHATDPDVPATISGCLKTDFN